MDSHPPDLRSLRLAVSIVGYGAGGCKHDRCDANRGEVRLDAGSLGRPRRRTQDGGSAGKPGNTLRGFSAALDFRRPRRPTPDPFVSLTESPLALAPEITQVDVLKQNWTDDEARWFYNVPQGSKLLPYQWFLRLEQPDSQKKFLDESHIRALSDQNAIEARYAAQAAPSLLPRV